MGMVLETLERPKAEARVMAGEPRVNFTQGPKEPTRTRDIVGAAVGVSGGTAWPPTPPQLIGQLHELPGPHTGQLGDPPTTQWCIGFCIGSVRRKSTTSPQLFGQLLKFSTTTLKGVR